MSGDTIDSARVLVVDDDPWIQRVVAAVLGHRGHAVECVESVERARAVLASATPALVIVAGGLPDGRGEAFVASLRRGGGMESVPTLLLADAAEAGAAATRARDREMDAVLAKPFRVEDLESAVTRALSLGRAKTAAAIGARRPTAAPLPPAQEPPPLPPAAVEGDVGVIGLSTVLLLLEMERKTGALHLAGDGKQSAEFILRKGRVIRAYVFQAENTVAGADAVYRALGWNDGWFSFHPVEVEGPDEIQAATSFLLMEGARRADLEAEAAEDLGEEVDI